MKKPKTLKDIYNYANMSYISDEAEQIVEDLRKIIKEWVAYLEKQGSIAATQYPRGVFQAEILREIFNMEENK